MLPYFLMLFVQHTQLWRYKPCSFRVRTKYDLTYKTTICKRQAYSRDDDVYPIGFEDGEESMDEYYNLYDEEEEGDGDTVEIDSSLDDRDSEFSLDDDDDDDDYTVLSGSDLILNISSSTSFPVLRSNETISMASLLRSIHLAPASEIAYFYLQNQIGLNEAAMWKITNEAGSVLGFTVANLEQKIETLRVLLDLSNEDIRIILTKQPSILHLNPTRNISPTIAFLQTSLDISKEHLRLMIVAYPAILCYSMDNLHSKIQFFLQDLSYTQLQTQSLLISQPKLLCCAVSTALLPRFHFLHKEVVIPLSDLQYILLKNPRILLYSLQQNLQPKLIDFFILRLQFRPSHLVQLLKSYPFIMDYNLEHHMLPIVSFFLTELDFAPMEMRRILLKFPRLLSFSLIKIKYVARLLRYQWGMNGQQVKRIFFQAPQIISIRVDTTLWSKVHFIQTFLHLTPQEEEPRSIIEEEEEESQQPLPPPIGMDEKLKKILVGMPTLLSCSIENNLKPKLEFLLKQVDGDVSELRDIIMTLPPLLGYSLAKRIQPRMEKMAFLGIGPPRLITTAITMKESSFEKWLMGRVQSNNQGQEDMEKIMSRKEKRMNVSPWEKRSPRDTHEDADMHVPVKLLQPMPGNSLKQDGGKTEQLLRERRIMHWGIDKR